MKIKSAKKRIMLWFSVVLVTVEILTFSVVISVGNAVIKKSLSNLLIQNVEDNVAEIAFYTTDENAGHSNNTIKFMNYKSGYLEIEDDFLNEVGGVTAALYTSDMELLYGSSPLYRELYSVRFSDKSLREYVINGERYYLYDRALTENGLDGLWIRGVISKSSASMEMHGITTISLILLPLILVAAIPGGMFLTNRFFSPIRTMNRTAEAIITGNDLKKRMVVDEESGELYELAQNFNDMLGRLENVFEQERRFTSDISHELRTPMSVITAQCELLLSGDEDNPIAAVEVIDRQCKRMNKLINAMLESSRLSYADKKNTKSVYDFSEQVKSICRDIRVLREKGIELEFSVVDGIYIYADKDLISSLLLNLISNAYKYGRPDGYIKVCLNKSEGTAVLTVEDNGCGMNEYDREHAFDRFYRASRSRSSEGIGLGLSISKQIAQMSDGELTVESEEGTGSTFILKIPAK